MSKEWDRFVGAFRDLLILNAILTLALSSRTGLAATTNSGTLYTYDSLGRVVTVTLPSGTITYVYDAAGNRLIQSVATSTSGGGDLRAANIAGGPANAGNSRSLAGGILTGLPASTSNGVDTGGGTALPDASSNGFSGSNGPQSTAASPAAVASIGVIKPPTANPVSATIGYSSTDNVIALDITGAPASGVAVSTTPSHGAAAVTGTSITYTPTSGYSASGIGNGPRS